MAFANGTKTEDEAKTTLRRSGLTRALKPKKIQTATMKRRSLKAKFIEAAPTKAQSPHVRAVVISPKEPPGV